MACKKSDTFRDIVPQWCPGPTAWESPQPGIETPAAHGPAMVPRPKGLGELQSVINRWCHRLLRNGAQARRPGRAGRPHRPRHRGPHPAILDRFNILEPHKLSFAQGDLAVLEGRLDDAETSFGTALSARDACPTRINLELVVETQGDLAAARGDIDKAEQRYTAALDTVRGAPENCFAGNDDADEDRRHIRQDAEPRLVAKIESLHQRRNAPPSPPSSAAPAPAPAPADSSAPLAPTTIPAPPPDASGPPPTTAPAPAPAQSPATGPDSRPVFGPSGGPEDTAGGGSEALNDIDPDRLPTGGGAKKPGHKLGGGNGDPLDELQQALRDSNATGGNRE